MMKPILFNTEMVQAILDGRKTVTRRVVKKKYSNTHLEIFTNKYGTRLIELQNDVESETHGKNPDGSTWHKLLAMREVEYDHKPYQVGDILYVRETWQISNPHGDFGRDDRTATVEYRADGGKSIIPLLREREKFLGNKWQPSLFMPKEAARLFLKVTNVRVERLQNMENDAPAKEGIRGYTKDGELYKYAVSDDWWIEYHKKHRKEFKGTFWQDMPKNPMTAFSYLWNSTIKLSDIHNSGWDANPWVWVVEFERIEKQNIISE